MVDILRRTEEVIPVVEETIQTGARVVWMQKGVINREAATKAREAGLLVVIDKCMIKEQAHLTSKNGK